MGSLQKLVLIGGGTAVDEVGGLIDSINDAEKRYEVVGILDDRFEEAALSERRYEVLGPLSIAGDLDSRIKFVFAIGSYGTRNLRHDIFEKCLLSEDRFETLIHPDVDVGLNAKIGSGSIIHKGSIIGANVVIEDFCVVTYRCIIGSDVTVQRYSMIASGSVLLVGCLLGRACFIGARSIIGEGVKVGPCSMIVMGSVVMTNVKPGAAVMGYPAKRTLLQNGECNVSQYYLDDWSQV